MQNRAGFQLGPQVSQRSRHRIKDTLTSAQVGAASVSQAWCLSLSPPLGVTQGNDTQAHLLWLLKSSPLSNPKNLNAMLSHLFTYSKF